MKSNSIPHHLLLSTSAQSRSADKETIEEFGIDSFTLMEIAANGAASFIQAKENSHKKGFYICGKGNNAGDALATARYLADQASHKIHICLVFGDSDLSADAQKNLGLLKKLSRHNTDITFSDTVSGQNLSAADYVVDGIFGTGLHNDLRAPLPKLVQQINKTGKTVYSMDIPSGLNSDTGQIHGSCIKASYTITFGTNKIGFFLNSGTKYTGEVKFISLPFPRYLQEHEAILVNTDLQESMPKITRQARHKYENGVVHIMAGSNGLTGAAIMAAKSAWKQGAGAVILYAPDKLLTVYETVLPQIIKVGIGKTGDSWFKESHSETILKHLKRKPGVLLAGPGIGTRKTTGDCLINVLSHFSGPVLLDADAISFWKELKNLPRKKKQNWLLTPHPGEINNYLKGNFKEDFERLEWIRKFVTKHSCSFLSKGNPTIVFSPKEDVYISGYDTTIFSRAGFGDVLSGTIACYMGISKETILSVVHALNNGYKEYLQSNPAENFGPEHLL